MKKVKCDLCVIGAGSGGLSVAAGAVAFGASVILVEKNKMGGDCLNVGCVPSKAFISAAKKAYEYKDAQKFGIEYEKPKVDFKKVQAHVSDIIAQIAPHDSVERFEGLGVKVIKGEGRFIDEKILQVNDEQISAKRFVIATGSSPAVPPIKGLDTVDYLTNENIFELKILPKHLAIIGGGPIGIELAQAFNRLGAKVSVIEKFNVLAKDDAELTKIALDNIREEGVNIFENTDIVEIKKSAKGINISINKGEEIICSHLLVATGRKKNTDGLGLKEANVEFDRAGIKTNASLLTSNKKIFAIGDVIEGMQFTHVAGHQASLVIKKAVFGLPIKQDQNIIPHVTYCDPEIAYVGMSENEVKAKYNDGYKVIRSKLNDNDRAKAMRQTLGLVKLILSKKGEILGVGIAAKNAGELINFFSYAIANKQKIGSFVKFISPYPTISEIVRRVAIESYRDKLSSPLLKIFTKFIRLLP